MRLAGLIGAAAALALSAPAAAQDVAIALQPGEVLLQVAAEGSVQARPDMVSFAAGIVTTGETAAGALAANSAVAERMLAAIRRSGIEPRDVRTRTLSVRPELHDPEDGAEPAVPRILGYVATNRLELRLRDLEKAPELIDALFTAGANEVDGPDLAVSEPRRVEREARRAAIAAAREEAETYAEALGMRVARVIRVSERGEFDRGGSGFITVTGTRIPQANLEAGEIETSIRVWIDYALVPR